MGLGATADDPVGHYRNNGDHDEKVRDKDNNKTEAKAGDKRFL